jgi:hypothetical protein
MQYAGCVAISVTAVSATEAQNALTPLLVARSRVISYTVSGVVRIS